MYNYWLISGRVVRIKMVNSFKVAISLKLEYTNKKETLDFQIEKKMLNSVSIGDEIAVKGNFIMSTEENNKTMVPNVTYIIPMKQD